VKELRRRIAKKIAADVHGMLASSCSIYLWTAGRNWPSYSARKYNENPSQHLEKESKTAALASHILQIIVLIRETYAEGCREPWGGKSAVACQKHQ
jgi:hypothetical protein